MQKSPTAEDRRRQLDAGRIAARNAVQTAERSEREAQQRLALWCDNRPRSDLDAARGMLAFWTDQKHRAQELLEQIEIELMRVGRDLGKPRHKRYTLPVEVLIAASRRRD